MFDIFENAKLNEDNGLEIDYRLEQVCSHIVSRLIRCPALRKTKTQLRFPINDVIHAPVLSEQVESSNIEGRILTNDEEVRIFLTEIEVPCLDDTVFQEILSTIEGAKGLIRPKRRQIEGQPPKYSETHRTFRGWCETKAVSEMQKVEGRE